MQSPLTIKFPRRREAHWRWILNTLLAEWSGLAIRLLPHEQSCVTLTREGRALTLPGVFLGMDDAAWLTPASLPRLPLQIWQRPPVTAEGYDEKTVPILFGHPAFNIDSSGNGDLGVDVFGSAFFMLSRYEEVALRAKDEHDRFPATSSFALKAGLLLRPLADEYLDLLWSCLQTVWPDLQRVRRTGRTVVTCDVDEPYERWILNPANLLKGVSGALLRRRSPAIAWRRVRNTLASRQGDYRHDPNWIFDWYMDACEHYGHRAEFYFIAHQGTRAVDAAYAISEPRMQRLLATIHSRGHLIGLHGSYDTYRKPEQLAIERARLSASCASAGAPIDIVHSRQHFLRWRVEETPDHLDAAGFLYDSTGGYADHFGFRFGSAREFPMWSWRTESVLRLRQRPLIMMEGTLGSYMQVELSPESIGLIRDLRDKCMAHEGDYVFLWHNSNLLKSSERNLFVEILALQ